MSSVSHFFFFFFVLVSLHTCNSLVFLSNSVTGIVAVLGGRFQLAWYTHLPALTACVRVQGY